MKKVSFSSGEVSLLKRLLALVGEPDNYGGHTATLMWTNPDVKAAKRILEKLVRAEAPSDPGVNAPAIEDALITYAGTKVAPLALPNWQRYARQGAAVGATVADAQIIGQWMGRQGWMQPGSQTLQSVLNNWSSWLGKARAAESGSVRPQAGLHGNLGQSPGQASQAPPRGRPAAGFGRKVPPTH